MKFIKYLVTGVFFGIVLSKSEVVSWYRIYEMFTFEAFHMYGVIGTAVVCGVIGLQLIKVLNIISQVGQVMHVPLKEKGVIRLLAGGIIFGLGWAMTGACPGPMFIVAGQGHSVFFLVILSAMLGTFVYGLMRSRLPH